MVVFFQMNTIKNNCQCLLTCKHLILLKLKKTWPLPVLYLILTMYSGIFYCREAFKIKTFQFTLVEAEAAFPVSTGNIKVFVLAAKR